MMDPNFSGDASAALRELAEPSARGDRVKAAIARAARLSGLSYWRTFDLWYRKARRVEVFEIDAINEALAKKRAEETRHELSELRIRLERLESALVLSDEKFHRENLSSLRNGLLRSR